jgi:hypothetical protein
VLAAHLLGLDEVPCIVLAHLTPTQRRACVLADNKLALNAGWDFEMLSLEIGELGEAGFDLSLTGFDEFELGELFAERTQGRTDPDDAGGARFGSRRCREPIRAFPCGPELRSSSGKGLSEAALSGPNPEKRG